MEAFYFAPKKRSIIKEEEKTMPKKKEVENLSWRDKILLEERTFLVLAVHRLPTHVDLELYDFASAGNFHREFPPHSELEVA